MNMWQKIFTPVRKATERVSDYSSPFQALQGLFQGIRSNKRLSDEQKLQMIRGWMYACIQVIAEDVSELELEVERNGEVLEDHKIMEVLDQPNDFMNFRQMLEGTQVYLESVGEAYWFIQRPQTRGDRVRLFLLRPDRVQFDQIESGGESRFVYKYDRGNGNVQVYERDQIIPFTLFDPMDKFLPLTSSGTSPLEAAQTAVETLMASTQYNRDFFENGAVPGGVIEIPTVANPEERKRILKSWEERHAGTGKGQRVGILPSGASFKEVGGVKDAQFAELYKLMRDEILAVFRVPKSILGMTDGSATRNSAEVTEFVFAKRKVKPAMRRIVETLNLYLVPQIDENVRLTFKSPVPEDEQQMAEVTTKLVGGGIMTPNEAREEFGMEPVENGDSVFMPLNMVPVGSEQRDNKSVKKKSIPESRALINWEIQLRQADQHVPGIKSDIVQFFEEQQDKVKENLDRYGKSKKKNAPELILPNEKQSLEAIVSLATPRVMEIIKEQGLNEMEFLGLSNFDVDQQVQKRVQAYVDDFAKQVDGTTRNRLTEAIVENQRSGESLDKLKEEIDSVYTQAKTNRAEMIARSEVVRASNTAKELAYRQSRVVKRKEWLTTPDDRRCQWCATMPGRVRELGESFIEKGDTVNGLEGGVLSVDYTSIQTPPLHPQCRCTLIPVIE